MSSVYLIALATLLLLALIALFALPSVRSLLANQLLHLRQRLVPPPPARTGTTVISSTGDEISIPDTPNPPMSLAARIEAAGGRRRLLAVALAALLALAAGWQIYRFSAAARPEQFVVLVAPFHDPGGAVSQTGRAAAAALVAQLPEASGQRVVARGLDAPPADQAAALELLNSNGADALVGGEISAGGMLDRATLQPTLLYRPSGPFAPAGWEGYNERFAMPSSYTLASQPLFGAVVLPALLGALADYGAGNVDVAFETLGQLPTDHPALTPTLPRALRGNILWARGDYTRAIAEYQAALRSAATADGEPQAALLANNLGAIQHDAGDAGASASFNQAIGGLAGADLAALRYNLGLRLLQAGQPAEALAEIVTARSLMQRAGVPASPELLLTLAATYRQIGQFDQSSAQIAAAERQRAASAAAVTAELRNITNTRLAAAATAQEAMLSLARSADARGPLLWELLGSDTLAMRDLNSVRDSFAQAAEDTQVLGQLWLRLATAKDAAGEPIAGQVAAGQARLAQAQWRERQRWLALVELERGSAPGARQPGGLSALWVSLTGDRTPLGRGRAILEDLLNSQPGDVDALLLLGNSQLLAGRLGDATAQFRKAAALAPGRPEPLYGQALATLPSERAQARQLLAQAIGANASFFPARQRLATLAEEDRDWPAVIEQRRWFAQHRPSDENTLALAAALRQSGPGSYAEAEQQLLPLANRNSSAALIALSELYQQHGDAAGAREVLARARRAMPRDAELAVAEGALLEQQNNPSAALAAYQQAIELDAANVPARLALGRLYAERGQPIEAGAQYEAALRAGANDPRELNRIGDVLLANRAHDAAATAYQRAIDTLGDAPNTGADLAALYHGLGQANLGRAQLDTAEAAERRALELRENNYAEALLGLGDIALLRNQPQQAIDQYNSALQLNGQLARAQIGLGRAAGAQGNWAVAQAHFRNAIALDERLPEAHLWLGEALIRQENAAAAIDAYVRALALRENRYPEAYFGLAQAQMASGRYDLANDNLALAIQLKPSYPEALLLQGKLFEQLGRRAAALDAYSRSIDASDQLAEPYYRRALLYARSEEFASAADDLEAAIKIQPNFSEAHYWLGRAYLAQGSPRPARAQFIAAIEQRGAAFADARFYQGVAEEQLGQRDDAVQSYRTALEQGTASEWAGEAQAALTRLRQP